MHEFEEGGITTIDGLRIATRGVDGITLACVAFVVVVPLVKTLWAWTVPEASPGAVKQGSIAGSLSWLTAVKIALFTAILSGFARGAQAHTDKKG